MPDDVINILVVDDLPEKLLSYRAILAELGQNLVEARSGEEALGYILRDEFAVILLDVNMPGGMTGFETAAMIRQRKKSAHTPIIFLTAFVDEVRVAEGYAHGAVDYIPTPVVPEILRAKVRVFVDLYRMTQQVKRQAAEQIMLAEERTKRAAAEEAGRRHRFLAEVSRALADSLDPDATARTLVLQTVPFLADFAAVTHGIERGPVESAWVVPGETNRRTRRFTTPADSQCPFAAAIERVFVSGRPEFLNDLNVPFYEPMTKQLQNGVVLPLRARNRTIGVLALASCTRRHGPDELSLAEDLASRAAIALDNSRLYREVQLADQQKNEFLSMLAHELRNPLAPIRNAVEVLRLRDSERPELRQAREMIDRQIVHLARLVDDLLDVSRITCGKIQLQTKPVNLKDIVAHAVEASRPFIERGRHRLELDLPDAAIPLSADPMRLAQVITNLLNNAAKYTEDGGEIFLALAREGNQAVLRIRDTGVGIPADMLGAVFDLFIQVDRSLDRASGGLGIGLTLVRRLVELHGGTVQARSEGPGRGSEFEVRLPIPDVAPSFPEPVSEAPLMNGRLLVLVVDDNVDSAESLATLLQLAGHEVQVAHNGPAALAAASACRPDVAVLDIGLPGMDGYALARQLRTQPETKHAMLIAMTGYGRDEDRCLSREAGLDHHFVKPLQFDVLQRLLASITDRGSVNGSRVPRNERFAARNIIAN